MKRKNIRQEIMSMRSIALILQAVCLMLPFLGSPAFADNCTGLWVGDATLYGVSGVNKAPSNLVFDLSLKGSVVPAMQIQRATSGWKYNNTGGDLGTAWIQPGYNDSTWTAGAGPFAFGNGGQNTAYFRRSFNVNSASDFNGILLRLLSDDGAVVYLNGVEVFRANMPSGKVSYNTFALSEVAGGVESSYIETPLPSSQLVNGTNVIAVEVHRSAVFPTEETTGPWQSDSIPSLIFDGVDDYASGAFNETLGDITLEAWVKLEAGATAAEVIILAGDYPNNYFALMQEYGNLIFHDLFNNKWTAVGSNAKINDGAWHHVAATRAKATGLITFYVDGKLDNAVQTPDQGPGMDVVAGALSVGNGLSYAKFKGSMHEVRVWNKVRTEAEIKSMMNAHLTDAPGLVASYGYDASAPGKLTDFASASHDLTLYNFSDVDLKFDLELLAMPVETIIPVRASWLYDDSGEDLGAGWRGRTISDSLWRSGNAVFGYGNPDRENGVLGQDQGIFAPQ
jgi:hypothetical protein